MLACMTCMGCGHDSPPEREGIVTRPGGEATGTRPGVGESNSLKHELDDAVWRVSGPGLSMRYDRGGVLFNTLTDGSTEIVDLDGADKVVVTIGKEGTDSVMTGASIEVNGKAVSLNHMKMLRHSEGRSWYTATDASDGLWIIVLP